MAHSNAQGAPSVLAISEFTLFPKLPKELRDEIWDIALPGPRILRVRRDASYIFHRRFLWGRSLCSIATAPIATALLHVSREARAVALRRYEPSFGGLLVTGPFYFDYERDSLMFTDDSTIEWFRGTPSLGGTPRPAAI